MFTDMQTRLARAGHCQACENYKRRTKQCNLCGCLVNLKVTLANESCPIGKWTETSAGTDFISVISEKLLTVVKSKL